MLRQRTKATDMWVCAGVLLLATTGCGDDGGNMDGSVPEDGGPDAQMDADVDKDADVDAADRDAGPRCRKVDSTIFSWPGDPEMGVPPTPHEGTELEMEDLCDEESCPSDFTTATETACDRTIASSYRIASGCGFDVLIQQWAAYHFAATTGALKGVERLSDIGYERVGCTDALFMAGERMPECGNREFTTHRCEQDDAGVDAGPDASVDAGADSGA